MRAMFIASLIVLLGAGCGSEIGDACSFSRDCSPDGDRVCDTESPGGYCTVFGCEVGSCPENSVCVRFFSIETSNLPCDPRSEDVTTNDCTADEICTIGGTCVPRNAEFRYCMAECSSGGDCRDQYECRTEELMKINGGEPVPEAGETIGDDPQPFCAPAPTTL